MNFDSVALNNDPFQELRDINNIVEGIFSLNWQQLVSLFDAGQPPVSVLAQACREALADENNRVYSSPDLLKQQYN